MNRAIPLILTVAIFGGGLAFLTLQTSRDALPPSLSEPLDTIEMPDTVARSTAPAQDDPKASTLATIKKIDRSAPSVGGTARYWEIIPMNALGQRIDGAAVTAKPTGGLEDSATTMEASGRTRWDAVPAGVWSVTVELEGEPTWSRDVVVAAGKALRTPVYLGSELRVSGEVRDSNGTMLPRNTPVFILPKGARYPTSEDLVRNARDGKEASPLAAIAVQTDAAGRFKTSLPRAGEYRIAVGTPRGVDTARWTQPKGVELTHGGPDHVIATVPARAELTIRLTGPMEERATAMSAFIFDAERAAQMEAQGLSKDVAMDVNSDDASMSLEEAQRAAKKAAMEEGGRNGTKRPGKGDPNDKNGGSRTGTARTMSEEHAKMQESDFESMAGAGGGQVRAPLFESGWRSIGSRNIGPDGEIIFNDLPADKELRFLFVRGTERIATLAPIRMRKEQRAIGTVILPPPALEPGIHENSMATLQIKDRPEDPESPQLEVGAEWTIAGQ